MVTAITNEHLRDLTRLLGHLRDLQDRLAGLVQAKVDAMKLADMAVMRELGAKEQAIVAEINEREGLRRRLMDVIGKELGMPEGAARVMTVSQLAARLPAAQATSLTTAAEALRGAVARLAQVNRVSGSATRLILNHLKWVFASVRPKDGKPVAYAGDGAPVGPLGAQLFEAVV